VCGFAGIFGALRTWAEDVLASEGLRHGELLDPAPIARGWRELQEGRRRRGSALWAVVMFEAWRARWVA
jgi:asparagine synthase (glutamine-hydrolysing)